MNRTRWLPVAVAAFACNCESGPGSTSKASGTTATAPVPPAEAVRDDMRRHYLAAGDLQRAIAHGRLTDARDIATWLADNASPRTHELLSAASAIAQATDVSAAAAPFASLAGACSWCHVTSGAKVTFPYEPEPADEPALDVQMRRHQWAAARLWEGVVGPSDEAWRDGIRVMVSTSIDVRRTTNAKPNADVVEYTNQIRTLAMRADNVPDPAARANLYGDMLTTCASCHAIVRPTAVGGTAR
jgi:cytochrome c553